MKKNNKSARIPKRCRSQNHYKSQLINQLQPTLFSPKSYNPGVQNMYCSATCMIVCVLRSFLVLGAICTCQVWSNKDIWTLIFCTKYEKCEIMQNPSDPSQNKLIVPQIYMLAIYELSYSHRCPQVHPGNLR